MKLIMGCPYNTAVWAVEICPCGHFVDKGRGLCRCGHPYFLLQQWNSIFFENYDVSTHTRRERVEAV